MVELILLVGLMVLILWPRLSALNQYLIVDEADRWHWAEDFVRALNRGDLAGTLVGDGYPGIVPVWSETIWILVEAVRRSFIEGQWIGEIGLDHLLHEWDRTAMLFQQRLPIVLLNTLIALAIVWAVWRIFGREVAAVSGLLIALDPFYLSDSRVNRAEAVITGLMTLSVLFLILYYQRRRFQYVIISGLFGGLSFLTKIQALTILPVVALAGLLIYLSFTEKTNSSQDGGQSSASQPPARSLLDGLRWLLIFGGGWAVAACLTWLALWPAMWVTPLETLTLVFNYTTRKVGAEGVNLFFMGQTFQDADPGPLFYPFVFLMRLTPLALLGLIGAVFRYWRQSLLPLLGKPKRAPISNDPFEIQGSSILVLFTVVYGVIMTIGSHKQDRYLMPIFLSVDILGAMGLVYLWLWGKQKFLSGLQRRTLHLIAGGLLAGLVILQTATVLPHHPYYYSYFNPLFGGGQTAVQTLRIGWGEGMDQVGAYLAAKPDSRNLVVSTRFGHNMLGFKGEIDSLGPGGSWTRADYVVLYIHQVQRRVDPGPGFIDYFRARPAEKVVTLGGIDYAWIYPVPFTTPADPKVSRIPGKVALLGYSWEENQAAGGRPTLRLLWENLGLANDQQLVARLVGPAAATEWTPCTPDPEFVAQATQPGAYVESLCPPATATLPPGLYTVQFGLAALPLESATVTPFVFPDGRQAARIDHTGQVTATSEIERLQAIAVQNLPAGAQPVDRIYDGRYRLVAYRLQPGQPNPGDELELRLFWQAVAVSEEPAALTVQLADSRSLPLGRIDSRLPPTGQAHWLPGQVMTTTHQFPLAPELDAPLAGQVEVTLKDPLEVPLRPTRLNGEKLDQVVARFTVVPPSPPTLEGVTPTEATWQITGPSKKIRLLGYQVSPAQAQVGESLSVSLFWQTDQPVGDNYVVFVHLLDDTGQIKAQNDSLPRAGAYPTQWWLPGLVVEDSHLLMLPEDIPGGRYQLVVGLYQAENGMRLELANQTDNFTLETIDVR